MDGAAADRWSAQAEQWAALWGRCSDPARLAVCDAIGVGPGTRVLDAGCGSGEFLQLLARRGARVAGIDPAPGMIALARRLVPDADLRIGSATRLPWEDGAFDAACAFNALQFADDMHGALREMTRVVEAGGFVAVANWADAARNDLDVLERAGAAAVGETLPPDGPLRSPDGLASLLREGSLEVVADGLVEVPWTAADEETLLRGVLFGDDATTFAAKAPAVLAAARAFADGVGGYRLSNCFRYAVGRTARRS